MLETENNISHRSTRTIAKTPYTKEEIEQFKHVISFKKWSTILINYMIFTVLVLTFVSVLLMLKCFNINKVGIILIYVVIYLASTIDFFMLLKCFTEYKYIEKKNYQNKVRMYSFNGIQYMIKINLFEKSLCSYVTIKNVISFAKVGLYIIGIILEKAPNLGDYILGIIILCEYVMYLRIRMLQLMQIKIIFGESEIKLDRRSEAGSLSLRRSTSKLK